MFLHHPYSDRQVPDSFRAHATIYFNAISVLCSILVCSISIPLEKVRKPLVFLAFSGGIEMEH